MANKQTGRNDGAGLTLVKEVGTAGIYHNKWQDDYHVIVNGKLVDRFGSYREAVTFAETLNKKSLPNKGIKNMNDELNDVSDGPEPYGAQVARRLHEDHSILMKDYDEMIGLLDHEGLKKHMTKTLEGLESNLTALEDLFSESYPHLKGLGEEEDNVETQDMDLEDDIETKDIDDLPDDGSTDDFGDDDVIDDSLDGEDPLEGLEDENVSDDAVPADSVDEDADIPSPDEVVEGMTTKRLKHKQKNLKSKKKSMDKNDDKEEKYLLAYRRKGVKSWVKKSFDDEDDRENFAKRLLKKAMDNDMEVDVMTKDPVADLEGVKSHDEDEDDIPSEMKRLIKSAAEYLDEISEDDVPFDDEKRMKAYHHYKNFEEFTGEEAEKGWHKDMDEEDEDKKSLKAKGKDFDEDEDDKDKKSLKSKSKAFGDDEEEDSEAVKMCKDCKSFLKSLAFEKAFGDQHREKAAYFKNALDSMDEDELGTKSADEDEDDIETKDMDEDEKEKKDFPDDDEDLETKDLDEDDDETDMKGFDEDELDDETMKMLRKSFSQQEKTLNVLAKQINGIL